MRTKKTTVILVSGKAGSGKDTVAQMLKEKLEDFPAMTVFKYGFANPIKFIAKSFFGWNGEKDDRGRKLLQQLGSVGREYDSHIWVKHFLQQLDKHADMFPFNFAVVSDWRFPNEYNYLGTNPILDVTTIRVFGRGGLDGEVASDVSEISLPEADKELFTRVDEGGLYDYQIENSGSLEDLEKKVDAVLSEISKLYIVE